MKLAEIKSLYEKNKGKYEYTPILVSDLGYLLEKIELLLKEKDE